ncbi:MAG: hypothetical protein KatS3mg109_0653 [Pirellulaceae bacterium]|nr:MAG: hypothetical protein KatS3mg109_0653 [Pirellulaceae bacterium]
MITVKTRVVLPRSSKGRRRMADKLSSSQTESVGRVPRVARVMALAIEFDRLLREGIVANTIELARLAQVTQPRITQVLNLLHLAPDIQEELLFLPLVTKGRDPVHEKQLRPLCAEVDWRKQRQLWLKLKAHA